MRCASLVVVFLVVFGSAFASRATRGEAVTVGNSGVRSAAEVYVKSCASCHGRDGRAKTLKGKMKHARNLVDAEWQSRVSDERIFNSIMNGKGKMPAFGKKVTEQEIDSLVSYVRALKK
jgi:mono/diheme cytochrome c family protein